MSGEWTVVRPGEALSGWRWPLALVACVALAGCRACIELPKDLAYPCDPDAGVDAGSQCQEEWRCGLEARCHPLDAGAAYLCSSDLDCEARWSCGPDGRCVDASAEFLPPVSPGAGRPVESVPAGLWSTPPALVSAAYAQESSNSSGARRLTDVCGNTSGGASVSWVSGGRVWKHAFAFDATGGAWVDAPVGGGPLACQGATFDLTSHFDSATSSASAPADLVALVDEGQTVVGLLDGGRLVQWRWQGKNALSAAEPLLPAAGFVPLAVRGDPSTGCTLAFSATRVRAWQDSDGGSWQLDLGPLRPGASITDALPLRGNNAGECEAMLAVDPSDAGLLLVQPGPDAGTAVLLELGPTKPLSGCFDANPHVRAMRRVRWPVDFVASGAPDVDAVWLTVEYDDSSIADVLLETHASTGTPPSRRCNLLDFRTGSCSWGALDVRTYGENNVTEVLDTASFPRFAGTVSRCRDYDGGSANSLHVSELKEARAPQSSLDPWQTPVRVVRDPGSASTLELDDDGRVWLGMVGALAPTAVFPDRAPVGVGGSARAPFALSEGVLAGPQLAAQGAVWSHRPGAGWERSPLTDFPGWPVAAVEGGSALVYRLGIDQGLFGHAVVFGLDPTSPTQVTVQARLLDADLARGPFNAVQLKTRAGDWLVLSAFDSLLATPLDGGLSLAQGGLPAIFEAPVLELKVVPQGRSAITSLAARGDSSDGGVPDGYVVAGGRIFHLTLGANVNEWAADEVATLGRAPVSVWFEGEVARAGFFNGTVWTLPSRVAIASPIPGLGVGAAPPSFAAGCGQTFAAAAGRLWKLEASADGRSGEWAAVSLPGQRFPVKVVKAFSDGVLAFDAHGNSWRLSWEGCQ